MKADFEISSEETVETMLQPVQDKLSQIAKNRLESGRIRLKMKGLENLSLDSSITTFTMAQKIKMIKDHENLVKIAKEQLDKAQARQKELDDLGSVLKIKTDHDQAVIDEQAKRIREEQKVAEKDMLFFTQVIKNYSNENGVMNRVKKLGQCEWSLSTSKLTSSLVKIEDIGRSSDKKDDLTSVNTNTYGMALLERAKKGWAREYVYHTQSNIGAKFTAKVEEDLPVYTLPNKVTKAQKIEFEVQQFPDFPKEKTDPTYDEILQLDQERVEFSMAFALEFLAKANTKPGKDNPIILGGKNRDELRYLWSAFMYLGKNNPDFEFNQDALKVYSRDFRPENELGFLNKLTHKMAWNSLYTTAFNAEPMTESYVQAYKNVIKDRHLNHEAHRKLADTVAQTVSSPGKK